MTPEERVQKAIKVLMNYGAVDGAHHKQYALDQTLRVLTGCEYEIREAVDCNGAKYPYQALGESAEYRRVVAEFCDSDNYGEQYEWDVGIPP